MSHKDSVKQNNLKLELLDIQGKAVFVEQLNNSKGTHR